MQNGSKLNRFGLPSRLVVLGLACLLLVGCTYVPHAEPSNQKKTIPVVGEVYVDGKPGWGVMCELKPVKQDLENLTFSRGLITNQEGKLAIGTYTNNDGAPPGDYILTFTQRDMTVFARPDEYEDLLGGRYTDITKPDMIKISIKEDDEKKDLGRIDLYTKEQ